MQKSSWFVLICIELLLNLETNRQLVKSFLHAARDGDVRMVDRWLQDGMPVEVSDESYATALYLATMSSRTDIAKPLLCERANVNRQHP